MYILYCFKLLVSFSASSEGVRKFRLNAVPGVYVSPGEAKKNRLNGSRAGTNFYIHSVTSYSHFLKKFLLLLKNQTVISLILAITSATACPISAHPISLQPSSSCLMSGVRRPWSKTASTASSNILASAGRSKSY